MSCKNLALVAGLVSGAALACGAAGAHAADADPAPQPPAATPAPRANDAPQLSEIVVTAQKRSEDLQTVPSSVTATTAVALQAAHIQGTRDLNQAVPGLTFGTFLGFALPYLRGIGQLQSINGIESPVAMYVDGVYIMGPGSGLMSLNDVRQIEVLRGPQGTLFGRNATGGVVQILTKDPAFTPSLDADVGYGSFNTTEAHLFATSPVNDTLATSFALEARDRTEGYGHNLTAHTNPFQDSSLAFQNKWLWRPNSRTEFELNLNYDHEKFNPDTGIFPGFTADDGVTKYGGYNLFGRRDSSADNTQYLASLKGSYDFGGATLSNLAGWHDYNNHVFLGQDPIPGTIRNPITGVTPTAVEVPIHNEGRTFTDELQLQSSGGGDFKWTIGFFYLNDVSTGDQGVFRNEVFIQQVYGHIDTVSYAGFAQASKTILPATRLTVGVRYTDDQLDFSGTSTTNPRTVALSTIPSSLNEGAPTYRVALDHDFTPDILGYVSWNRGFRSGGYTINNFTNPPVMPEGIDSYEAGLKTKLFDNRLRINASAFYYQYTNIQVRAVNSNGISQRLNAASGRGDGLDIDFDAAATEYLTLSGGAEFLDAKFTSFPRGPCPIDLPQGGVNSAAICDLSGNRFPYAPTASMTLRANYRIPSSVGEFNLNLSDSYSSGYFFEADNVMRQPEFNNVAGTIAWLAPNRRWGVDLWVRNMLNETIFAGASTTASRTYIPGEPRTVGATVRLHL